MSSRKKNSRMVNVSTQKQKAYMSPRNQALIQQINEDSSDMDRLRLIFSKWRIFTYIWIVFFPPYGLYRVWSKKSTFSKAEKYVWTFIIVVYVASLVYNLFF